jgi:hypothetical protein
MVINWKGYGKGAVTIYWRYDSRICLTRLRKSTKELTLDSECPNQDSNQAPEVLLLDTTYSVQGSIGSITSNLLLMVFHTEI